MPNEGEDIANRPETSVPIKITAVHSPNAIRYARPLTLIQNRYGILETMIIAMIPRLVANSCFFR